MNPGYEVPISWRTKEPNLKNNKTRLIKVALKRLNGLMKKFAKEPEYQEYKKSGEEIPE